MSDFSSFQAGLLKLQMELSEKQCEQFYSYYEQLIEKNKVMNLTAITDYEEVIHKHFLDSLSIVLWNGWVSSANIIDVGTGAGFPGIPIKIAFPECRIVLMDSLNKRVQFLNEVIESLKLSGIQAVHARAEDMGRQETYRERFDLCVSRAVANMSTLSEYCMPFVKVGGYFIPYKSGRIEEELKQSQKAVSLLGGNIQDTLSFSLPNTDMERTLVLVRKEKEMPKKYPRKAGIPAKEPL